MLHILLKNNTNANALNTFVAVKHHSKCAFVTLLPQFKHTDIILVGKSQGHTFHRPIRVTDINNNLRWLRKG